MSVVIPSKIQSLDKVVPSGVSGGGGVFEAKADMGITIKSLVDGVKGDAEAVYRTGKVNLTPADLGIPDDLISDPDYVHTDNNFTDADKATLDSIDETYATKSEIPRNTSDLVNDSNYVADADYVHTDQNFTSALKSRLESVENGAEVNVIESVKRNGIALPVAGKAVDVSVPTATSELTNDAGFLSAELDPTVPAWAKQATKPAYTASEVGALPDTTAIPSKTSDLTNDSGFITSSAIPTNVSTFANDVPYAVANADGASVSTMAIPKGNVDSTSTATVFTATVNGITELKTGVVMMLSNHVVTSASGFTININGLGAKPCYNNMALSTRDTTIFNVNYTMLFVYDESLNSADGGWWCYRGYNSDNNTIGYTIRTNQMQLPVKTVCYRYRLLFTSMDGQHYIPANTSTSTNATASRTPTTEPFDPFGRIVYYNATTALSVGDKPTTGVQWQQYNFSLGYSFNVTGRALVLTVGKPVWLKCTPQSDGSVVIDPTVPYVQELPTTEDGYVYIWLGVAYSATNVELTLEHPIKWFKDGAIRNWWG